MVTILNELIQQTKFAKISLKLASFNDGVESNKFQYKVPRK